VRCAGTQCAAPPAPGSRKVRPSCWLGGIQIAQAVPLRRRPEITPCTRPCEEIPSVQHSGLPKVAEARFGRVGHGVVAKFARRSLRIFHFQKGRWAMELWVVADGEARRGRTHADEDDRSVNFPARPRRPSVRRVNLERQSVLTRRYSFAHDNRSLRRAGF